VVSKLFLFQRFESPRGIFSGLFSVVLFSVVAASVTTATMGSIRLGILLACMPWYGSSFKKENFVIPDATFGAPQGVVFSLPAVAATSPVFLALIRVHEDGRYLVGAKGDEGGGAWLFPRGHGGQSISDRAFVLIPGSSPSTVCLWSAKQHELAEIVAPGRPLSWVGLFSGGPKSPNSLSAALSPSFKCDSGQHLFVLEALPSTWSVEVDSDVKRWQQAHPSAAAKVVRFKHQSTGAYINVVEASIRGHGNPPNNGHGAKASDPGTVFELFPITSAELEADDSAAGVARRKADASQLVKEDAMQEEDELQKLSKSAGGASKCGNGWKCVISYGLYGSNPKYTAGAIENAALAAKYFSGWTPRYYASADVPTDVRLKLEDLGAEVIAAETLGAVGQGGKGMGIAGMFWRFLVADDTMVDRFIIRDTDSVGAIVCIDTHYEGR
jgi:hypothetical protein